MSLAGGLNRCDNKGAGGMREGLQAGVEGRSKALGREEDRGFSAFCFCPTDATEQDAPSGLNSNNP